MLLLLLLLSNSIPFNLKYREFIFKHKMMMIIIKRVGMALVDVDGIKG